ncbi:PEP-CTERM sorting domain-containing protein [Colwellia ponticola]|nr:PEP-CTERM sorting domain-containing protein [Colwellia ponticola]
MKNFTFVKNLLITISLLSVGLFANASDFKVDGCLGCGNDNYTVGFNVEFDINGTPANGFLYLGETQGSQYMYFEMPLEFVDTAYGDEALAHGWANKKDPSKIRPFDKIIGSDRLIGFKFPNSGNEVKVDIDVLACTEACIQSKKAYKDSDNTYQSSGYQNTGGKSKSDGDDYNNNADDIFAQQDGKAQIKTTMDYNVGLEGFNSLNSGATGADAGKWLYHYGFEFEFKTKVFGDDIANLTKDTLANYLVLGDSHASSGKEVDSPDTHITGRCDPDCLTTTTITTTSIPEPTSWAIFALGIVGLSLSRRQRN